MLGNVVGATTRLCRTVYNKPVVVDTVSSIKKQFGLVAENSIQQCKAIAIQKTARTFRLAELYGRLYDKSSRRRMFDLFTQSLIKKAKSHPLTALLGAAAFIMKEDTITDTDMVG